MLEGQPTSSNDLTRSPELCLTVLSEYQGYQEELDPLMPASEKLFWFTIRSQDAVANRTGGMRNTSRGSTVHDASSTYNEAVGGLDESCSQANGTRGRSSSFG